MRQPTREAMQYEHLEAAFRHLLQRYADHEECRRLGCSEPDSDIVGEFKRIAEEALFFASKIGT